MSSQGLTAGVVLHEVATTDIVYEGCKVLYSDAVGLLIEVERTRSEGGNVEKVVSQILLPWHNVKHVVLMESRE
jgi:hypothetical protein